MAEDTAAEAPSMTTAAKARRHGSYRAGHNPKNRLTQSARTKLTPMALNKKQKKQIDALKNKLQKAQQLLSAARNQPDDPAELPRLEEDVKSIQAEIDKIRNS